MPYTPASDTSTLVVSLGFTFEGDFSAGSSTVTTVVANAITAADVGRVVMLLQGNVNVYPGFSPVWTTVASIIDSTHFTVAATPTVNSMTGYINCVVYRPLPGSGQFLTGAAPFTNTVKSGSIEVDLSLTEFATAKFRLISADGSLIPKPNMPLLITDTEVGVEYFGGEIQTNTVTNEPGTTVVYSDIVCEGWEIIAKRLYITLPDATLDGDSTYGAHNPATGTFVNLRADQIADYLQRNYTQNDGTAGSYDTTGPTLPSFQAITAKFSDVLDQLCSNATATAGKQFNWWFSPRKVLNIKTLNSHAAAFNLKDGDGSAGNALAPLQNTYSNQNYFNRTGGIIESITQQFVGDGVHRAFTLNTAVPFTALGQVTATLNGQSQTVGLFGVDKNKQWLYTPGSTTIVQGDGAAATLTSTDVLSISFPVWIILVLDALPEQGVMVNQQSGSGTWEQFFDLQAVSTAADASSYLQSMLNESKAISQQLQIQTYRPGLLLGDTIQVQLAGVGVSSVTAFIIDSISITSDNNRKLYTITLSLDAPYAGSWKRQLRRGLGTKAGLHGHPLAVAGSPSSQFVAAGGAAVGAGSGLLVATEVPAGTIDGSNRLFSVTKRMAPSPNPILMLSGAVQDPLNSPVDFTYSNTLIQYAVAPEVNAKHVIWYWYSSQPTGRARLFNGAGDKLLWGANAAWNIGGDLSIGFWIKIPKTSANASTTGTVIMYGDASSGGNDSYKVFLGGSPNNWTITAAHEDTLSNQDSVVVATGLKNDTWYFIGIVRDATAKTYTGYIGDGANLNAGSSGSYTHTPASPGGVDLTVGYQFNSGIGLNLYLNAIVEEHYIWNRKLTSGEITSAMTGQPPTSGNVLNCQMGNSPEIDLSPTAGSGTVTGTVTVQGHP